MKKLHIETYGCQMNVADSEVVASIMQMAGYELCDKPEDADAIFLNTCSVRDKAEQRIVHRLEALHAEQKQGRHVILGVLGCMAERVKDRLLNEHFADLVAGPDALVQDRRPAGPHRAGSSEGFLKKDGRYVVPGRS